MIIKKTTGNIEVTGIVLTIGGKKIEQVPAKTFQTFKKLNIDSWAMEECETKKEQDKRIGQINVIFARQKSKLRDEAQSRAITLINRASTYGDIKIEEKLDAKGKKHATIQLKEKPMRMSKAGQAAWNTVEAKKKDARIAALEAQLEAIKNKKPSKESNAAPMLPELA